MSHSDQSTFRWSTTLDQTRTDKDFNLVNLILELVFLFFTDMNQREPLGDPLLESGVNLNIGPGANLEP